MTATTIPQTVIKLPLYLLLFQFILNERRERFNGTVPTIGYLADRGEKWAGRKLKYRAIYPSLKNLEKYGYLNYICGSWVVNQEKLEHEMKVGNIVLEDEYRIVNYNKPKVVRSTRKTHYHV